VPHYIAHARNVSLYLRTTPNVNIAGTRDVCFYALGGGHFNVACTGDISVDTRGTGFTRMYVACAGNLKIELWYFDLAQGNVTRTSD
jgi:hypothetical protein